MVQASRRAEHKSLDGFGKKSFRSLRSEVTPGLEAIADTREDTAYRCEDPASAGEDAVGSWEVVAGTSSEANLKPIPRMIPELKPLNL